MLEKILENPLDCKEIQPVCPKSVLSVHWKDRCWSWSSSTLATWCEELIHWKRPWCCERLKAGGEGDNRGCDGWLASPVRWRWVWASSGSWWWTGRPDELQFMGSQSIRYDGATELNWYVYIYIHIFFFKQERKSLDKIAGKSIYACTNIRYTCSMVLHVFKSSIF